MSDQRIVVTSEPVQALHDAIRTGLGVVVVDRARSDEGALAALYLASRAAGVGSASPVPVPGTLLTSYDLHDALPPAPTLALPCPSACALSAEALASLPSIPTGATVADAVSAIAVRMLQHGWRHVGTPGVASAWHPEAADWITPSAAWTTETVASLVGPSNVGLEAHVSWAASRIGRLRVVVDGACIVDGPNTGTQHLVIEIARWLARTRPTAEVVLATRPGVTAIMRAELAADDVEVAERADGLDADVLYRPYQMLDANELPFVLDVGRRGIVGQLDMIGYSNPFYHPAPGLFFFARNLQRHLMRTLDGVTFISRFGRDSALAECPDLPSDRLHVVSCGADPNPLEGEPDRSWAFDPDASFVVCLSSTFWHKNRAHTIATFERLVGDHGYTGHLVIGGPEPFYGRSIADEDDVLARLPADVRARVHRIGHVSEANKWWLLRHAGLALYPSVVEGFGLVPFESAAVATPCLTFEGTAPGELLGSTSATIDTWDPARWASAANDLLSDPSAAAANVADIQRAARATTWQVCAERTWDAIDHALASPRRLWRENDGGRMSRVTPDRHRPSRAASLRFNIVRVGPGVARRLRPSSRSQGDENG